MHPKTQRQTIALVVNLIALTGCATSRTETDEAAAVLEQSIISGTTPARGSLAGLGVVRLSNATGGGCTGTLITNQHVLTARHCVRHYDGGYAATDSAPISATLEGPNWFDDQTRASTALAESTSTTLGAGDYALITLAAPLTVNGSLNGFFNPFYTGTDASLAGQALSCVGYGHNALAVMMPPTAQTGFGTLRTAQITVSSVTAQTLRFTPNGTGQIQTSGDSGSTCFSNGRVTGVCSYGGGTGFDVNGDGDITSSEYTSVTSITSAAPSSFRSFVNARVYADATVTYSVLPAKTTVLKGTFDAPQGTGSFSSGSSMARAALRSGFYEARVTNTPPHTMCPPLTGTAPISGNVSVSGRCLDHGLLAALTRPIE